MGRKLTNEEIVQKIYELVGGEYTKLDNTYINSKTKFPIRHELCGHEYETKWTNFQSGRRCPKCAKEKAGEKLAFNNESVVRAIYNLVGDEYTKLEDLYENAHTKFRIRHEKCNFEYMVSWSNFQSGFRCPKCSGLMKLTNEDVVQKMYDLVGDEYTKLDDTYINNKTKFPIRHELCGCIYEVNWHNFRNGNRCPKCNQSKGEKFIEDYLTNQGISFATQVRFDDCKYKNTLPFDFGIIDDNKRVIALVEYNGIQHYQPVKAWGGEEKLEITQLRDAIKDNFCKEQNIPLLRIRYDENIEEKLNLFINQEAKGKV